MTADTIVFTVILAFLHADDVFITILALSSTDTVVLQGLLSADAVIFIMSMVFLSADTF